MIEAVLIPISLYLPGHFLGGFLARKGDGWAELWLLRIACSAAVSTPILVALALLGRFETPFILGALGVCSAVAAFCCRKRDGLLARPGRWDLVALVLVAVALALYAHPAEYVLKDRDPGVYTVAAAKLARTGELLTRDPLVGAVASFHEFEYGAKHPGFFVHGTDLLVPQFFPGPFAWLGLGSLVGGTWGELYVVPLFGALSVGMAFVLGRELFGRWAGLVGAALLAVSYTQVWWSRYPSSEVMTQFFILAGLWSAARFVRVGGAGTGVLAGALLGGAMMIRVDAFLAALVVPALILHDFLLGRSPRRWASVCAPLLLAGGALLLYVGTLGERYLDLIQDLHVPESFLWLSPYLLGGASLIVLSAVLVLRRSSWSGGYERLLALRGRRVALLAALVLLGGALWVYFVLPEPWEGLPEYWGGDAGPMAEFHAYDRQVAVRMVWFLTPVVAVLGMAGCVLTAHRLSSARALFLGAVLAFGVLYVALPNVAPDLPWATRRFVPLVFPGLCLLAGYAIVEAGRVLGRAWDERAGTACAAALALSALVWSVYVAWPVYGVRELAGAVEGVERLEEAVPDSQVVYVELPGDDYAATLDYLYGRPVLAYERDQFRQEIPNLREAGLLKDAVYVTVEEKNKPVFQGLRLREADREEVSFLRLEDGFKDVPRDTQEERQRFRIYELEQTS
ncbi:MAG: glycosyltransferase family 39 protein [Actinomycetota bacterium]|nr:glycosyltransferase family 39 protein [Actinomycetota bacterium]